MIFNTVLYLVSRGLLGYVVGHTESYTPKAWS